MGLVQAPFLLSGTLDQHLTDYTKEPHQTVESLKEDIYVDGVIGGASTTSAARDLKESATKILGDAKFQLHKWHSNVKSLEQGDQTD